VPGVVAFPVQACGLLVLATLTGMVIWGERFSRKTWIGLLLAGIALVLINTGRASGKKPDDPRIPQKVSQATPVFKENQTCP
jgi:drug/metabolite transporter (DMT)-like permease